MKNFQKFLAEAQGMEEDLSQRRKGAEFLYYIWYIDKSYRTETLRLCASARGFLGKI
ncbi:MAG: hypothetical protein LBV17_04440 [Treponema sp.]|jgi:hypothetical protein|nr:hypothetical protein [Treponema sp.]